MKKIFLLVCSFLAFLLPGKIFASQSASAIEGAVQQGLSERINAVRQNLQEKITQNGTEDEFLLGTTNKNILSGWVNWTDWGNWNNWANWDDWAKWSKWDDWVNWGKSWTDWSNY